jgi:hypothetical protein
MKNTVEKYIQNAIVGDTVIVRETSASVHESGVGILIEIVEPFTKYHSRFTHYVYFDRINKSVGFVKSELERYIPNVTKL